MADPSTYKKPDWFTQHVFNPAVKGLMFFNGVKADSPDDVVAAEVQRHPVCRLHIQQSGGPPPH